MLLTVNNEASILMINCLNLVLSPILNNDTRIFVANMESPMPIPVTLYDLEMEIEEYDLQKNDVYVLDTRKKKLNDTLTSLEKRTFFNPRALFIVVTANLEENLGDIMTYFFLRRIIILKEIGEKSILVQSHGPFEMGKIGFTFSLPISESICTGGESGIRRLYEDENKEEFSSVLKIGAGGNVPSIIISTGHPLSGVDLDILNIISEKLQFQSKFTIVEEFAGKKNPKDLCFNGSLGYLERREVDLVVGGVLPTSEGSMSFDFTQATSINRYAWIVPAAKVRPFWKSLILTFSIDVWMIFSASLIIILVILSLTNKFITNSRYFLDKELLKLYSMCLTSISVRSSELSSKKIMYTTWYLFLLIFVNYFTAKLLSNLLVIKFEYQIHTLDELTGGNWKFCIFSDLTNDISYEGGGKFMSCTNCATCTNKTAHEGDVVSIRSEKLTLYEMKKFYTSRDRLPLVFILKQYYLVTYDVMVFRKNHPLYDRFNRMLGYLIASGIYERISEKYLDNTSRKDIGSRSPWMSLKYENLGFIFAFLIHGWVLGFIVFLFELFLGKLYEKMSNRVRKN